LISATLVSFYIIQTGRGSLYKTAKEELMKKLAAMRMLARKALWYLAD
jgi:hypothetical protein